MTDDVAAADASSDVAANDDAAETATADDAAADADASERVCDMRVTGRWYVAPGTPGVRLRTRLGRSQVAIPPTDSRVTGQWCERQGTPGARSTDQPRAQPGRHTADRP